MRGGSIQEMKQTLRKHYNELVNYKMECFDNCIEYICSTQDPQVCTQTKDFLKTKPAADSSGFCNNMMAGFPKTCRPPTNSQSMASYDECACDRFRKSLIEFERLNAKLATMTRNGENWVPLSTIAKDLLEYVRIPGHILSEETSRFLQLQRISGSRFLLSQ